MIAILYMYFHYQIQLPILQTAEGEKFRFCKDHTGFFFVMLNKLI